MFGVLASDRHVVDGAHVVCIFYLSTYSTIDALCPGWFFELTVACHFHYGSFILLIYGVTIYTNLMYSYEIWTLVDVVWLLDFECETLICFEYVDRQLNSYISLRHWCDYRTPMYVTEPSELKQLRKKQAGKSAIRGMFRMCFSFAAESASDIRIYVYSVYMLARMRLCQTNVPSTNTLKYAGTDTKYTHMVCVLMRVRVIECVMLGDLWDMDWVVREKPNVQ